MHLKIERMSFNKFKFWHLVGLLIIVRIPLSFTWNNVKISSVRFCYTRFLYSFRRVKSDLRGHVRLLTLWATRLFSQWMLHWWRVNDSAAREPCLAPPIDAEHEAEQAASTVFHVFEMSGPVIQPRLHFWWRVLNQPYHMAGKRTTPIFVFRVIIPTMQL